MVLGILVIAAAVGVSVALATVTSTILRDTNDVRLRIDRSAFVPSADQPEFSSGWHTHPGPVIIQVQEGTLEFTQGPSGGPCETTKVRAGETFVETAELPVLAEAKQAVKWTATFIVPVGVDLRTNVSDPCS
jgi:quercetin dioxygenase-like cupin family protein